MVETKIYHPAHREFFAYAQIVTLLLLLGALAAILFLMLVPQWEWIDLGSIDELRQAEPVHRTITLRGQGELGVWVVYADERWFVFDGWTPIVPFRSRCQYQWQMVSGRFEDPCSGVKFSRTGEFVNVYNQFEGRRVQNLD